MSPDTLRLWDETVGAALCRMAGWFASRKSISNGKVDEPRDVLVIKLTEMGSTVLALPALRELRSAWPNARLHFLVFRGSRAILDTMGITENERIIEVDENSTWSLIASGFKALRVARKIRPAVVLDFDFFSRLTALFSFAAGFGARVGFMPFNAAGRERGLLLTHRVNYSPLRHTSESFLALVRSVTRDSDGEPFFRGTLDDADLSLPAYQPKTDEREKIGRLLRERGMPDDARIYVVNPNASDLLPLRKWPRERFEEVIMRILAAHPGNHIVLAGGTGDAKDCREISGRLNDARVIDLSGRTSFGEFLALCEYSQAIISNDGGPAHFAGLVGLPAVVLFGPESPHLYRPLSPVARVLYRGLPCSPCVHAFNAKKSSCQRAVCLEEITVQEVLDEVGKIPPREARAR